MRNQNLAQRTKLNYANSVNIRLLTNAIIQPTYTLAFTLKFTNFAEPWKETPDIAAALKQAYSNLCPGLF